VYNDLRSALGRARRLELIGRNPAEAVDRPRAAPYRPTIWTDEELGRFLATCRVYARESLPFVFAYVSGARQGEVLGLQWRHVDLASGTVYFVQDLERPRGGGFAFGSVKTGNSARAVKLPSAVTEMLREQRERRPSPPHDLVFANRTGNPLHGHNLTTRTLKRLCREAQVPPIRFHDLRHLHNTVLMRRGVNPKIVAARAGHATTAFTLDRYSWATADLQDAAAEALGRTMGR
jgi:integrase